MKSLLYSETSLYVEYTIICLLFVLIAYKSIEKRDKIVSDTLISLDVSNFLKALCCIVIILHHYALRVHILPTKSLWANFGGFFSLTCFIILSAYGITKVELKNPANFVIFFKKRFLKIYIPVTITTILFIFVYLLIEADNITVEDVLAARGNAYFVLIGSKLAHWNDYLEMILLTDLIDGALWYVQVTLIAYFIFFISKSFFPLTNRKLPFFILYSILISALFMFFYLFDFPPCYYMNLWGLIIGTGVALYEKELLNKKIRSYIMVVFFSNLFLIPFLFWQKYLYHYLASNISIISIFILNEYFRSFTIKRDSLLLLLSTLSLYIYLVHTKILTIEWYYCGFISVLFPIFVIVVLAYILYRIQHLILK